MQDFFHQQYQSVSTPCTETICPVTAHLLWQASEDTRNRGIVPGIFKILEGPLLKSTERDQDDLHSDHLHMKWWPLPLQDIPIGGPHHRLLFRHDKFLARKDFALRKLTSKLHVVLPNPSPQNCKPIQIVSQSPISLISHQGSDLYFLISFTSSLRTRNTASSGLRSGQHRTAIWPISEFFSNILSIHKQKSWSRHNTEAIAVQQLDRYMEMRS